MRRLAALALALLALALAPACETVDEPVDRLEGIADNECGEVARCMVEMCADVEGMVPEEDECTAECRGENPCAADDRECRAALNDRDEATSEIYTQCVAGTDDECEASLSACDDVADVAG